MNIEKYTEELITLRHYFHQHPELALQEVETSAYIRKYLEKLGYEIVPIEPTGLIAELPSLRNREKLVVLRAEMDALPIQEQTNLPYASVNQGCMHACGHDAHTACLLGAAAVLNQIRNDFEGTILLVFQPGEEKAPGGARLMLEAGLFEEHKPELIIAQHVSVDFPTGTMAFLPGKIMASADEIHVKVKGKGGHGALPHLVNDTVLATAQTLVSLQQVKSRLCHPLTPMVLTFGKLIAGGAQNIIPHEVQLSGTFRTFDEEWRHEALAHIRRIITETTAAYGCTAVIDIPDGYPCVVNDLEITQKARAFAEEWVGKENTLSLEPRMTSEDFAFFSQKYPATFYRFGVKGEINADSGGLHSATFRIDEEALQTGAGGMAWLAYSFLKI